MTIDRGQLIYALVLAATALFVLSGMVGFRHRRAVRIAAVAVYGAGFLAVAVYAALWLAGIVG